MFEKELNEWVRRVITAYADDNKSMCNTYQMIVDIDKIIADAFNHDTVLNLE